MSGSIGGSIECRDDLSGFVELLEQLVEELRRCDGLISESSMD